VPLKDLYEIERSTSDVLQSFASLNANSPSSELHQEELQEMLSSKADEVDDLGKGHVSELPASASSSAKEWDAVETEAFFLAVCQFVEVVDPMRLDQANSLHQGRTLGLFNKLYGTSACSSKSSPRSSFLSRFETDTSLFLLSLSLLQK